tara:strand:+ start:47 stop:349 length:303 start_codon:yes stop_codon:yes gene_type:complete
MGTMDKRGKLTSTVMISILAVWFVANLISQFVFIFTHGTPYDGIAMLSSLGSFYYAILILESLLWLWFLGFISLKGFKHITKSKNQGEIGNFPIPAKSPF